jgi:SAM-dependent methyltransferase
VKAAEHWHEEAGRWAAWTRTPGHDAYWYYRDAFFELVPPPGRATLEIGCGEGRVSRDLAARGHTVTGVDITPHLVELAVEADPASTYLVGDAEVLPFPDGSFDLAVAYNSLMDVDDMPAAVREAARVLEPGGALCICVTHPMMDAGSWEDGRFVVDGSYLETSRFEGTFARDGLEMTFRGWCYPLEAYSEALAEAGFAVELLREPAPSPDAPEHLEHHRRLPLFLMLRARRPRP